MLFFLARLLESPYVSYLRKYVEKFPYRMPPQPEATGWENKIIMRIWFREEIARILKLLIIVIKLVVSILLRK